MRHIHHTLFAITAAVFIAGCTTTVTPTPEANAPRSMPIAPLVEHILFFNYDSHALPDNTQDVIAAHIKYLIQHPSQKLLIEGAADESGDEHYNFALGMKRADAIKQAFIDNGISSSQLLARSIGEQRPLNHEGKPYSNARNRRVTLVY